MARGGHEPVSDERAHLLSESSIQESDDLGGSGRRNSLSGRLIVVEPYLLLYCVADKSMEILFNQYLYQCVGLSMNITVGNLTIPGDNGTRGDCDLDTNSTGYRDRHAVQSTAELQGVYIRTVSLIPTIFAMLVLGSMSDRVGRKINFLLPPVGSIFRAALFLIAVHFQLPPNYFYLNSIELLLGALPLAQAGSFAYVADTASQKYIPLRMTILTLLIIFASGASGIGIKYWIGASGYFWPAVGVIGINLILLVYAKFFIPEIVRRVRGRAIIKVSDLIRSVQLYIKDNGTDRRWKLILVTVALVFHYMLETDEILAKILREEPLCWGAVKTDVFHAVDVVVGLMTALIGGCAYRWIPLPGLVIFANTTLLMQQLYVLLVNNTTMMFFFPVVGFGHLIAAPMTVSILSSYVSKHEQGALMAFLYLAVSATKLAASVVGSQVYSATMAIIQGRLVFILPATMQVISSACIIIYLRRLRTENRLRIAREIIES